MEAGDASWADCTNTAGLSGRLAMVLSERSLDFTFLKDAITDLGQSFGGGGEKCYSVNNLGGTGWLTNTAVNGLAKEACTAAVNAAITAGTGVFTTTKSGFYQGGFGPISDPKVKFFLSVLLTSAELAGLQLDVHQLGVDLCTKGIGHLTSDSGCIAKRKAGAVTEHWSVNGGQFDRGLNGKNPIYDNGGVCTNCFMTLIMEASNMVDIDGETAIPISG